MDSKAAAILEERRKKWKSKEIIRRLYDKWYLMISQSLTAGRTLELGGGSGNIKEYFSESITSDILYAPWLDAVLDAQKLPFKNSSFDNIVLFDVLHHLLSPSLFFYESERVLRKNGRLIIMEPYVSWSSFIVYRFFHQEGMNWHVTPLDLSIEESGKEPFQGNQAIPTLIFEKYYQDFMSKFSHLKVIRKLRSDYILYPLSGGFHHPQLCPMRLFPFFSFLEGLLRPLSRFLSFRFLLVLEKR